MPDGAGAVHVEKVVATAVQIVVGVADDRQMTFSTGFEGDEDLGVVHARFDLIMSLADRQRARYEIKKIEGEVRKTKDTLSQLAEDCARIATDHEHNQAMRRVELDERKRLRSAEKARFAAEMDADILALQERRSEEFKTGQEEHHSQGRMTAYKPVGHRGRTIALIDEAIIKADARKTLELDEWDQRFDAEIATAEAEIVKADAERAATEQNMDHSVKRHTEFLADAEGRLAEARATAGS